MEPWFLYVTGVRTFPLFKINATPLTFDDRETTECIAEEGIGWGGLELVE